ncbi:hypothetical protein ACOSQ2_018123 [Xanthoceras sorbifolium]
MSKILTFFFFLALLVFSTTKARPLPAKTWQPSNPHMPFPSNPIGSSSEESSMDDDGCRGLASEECLMRRSMVAHTDYIYTQDVNGP